MINEIVKKVIESDQIQNIIKDINIMKGQIKDINVRILSLELKVDRLERAINKMINKDSPKNIVANRYLDADYSNSGKKNEIIVNTKINIKDKIRKNINYEIFLTNPNNKKVTKDTNSKRLRRYDSSIFINPNVKPVTIPKKSNTKLT